MFDLGLVTRGNNTVGWGHASRMYALALEAERRRLRALLVTDTPEVPGWRDWPSAVCSAASRCAVSVYDGVARSVASVPGVVVDDCGTAFVDGASLVINPQFGATGYAYAAPALLGPRWMPLWRKHSKNADGRVMAYRASAATLHSLGACRYGDASERGPWAAAVVPPSVIAYECMASGIPVLLHMDVDSPVPGMNAALQKIGQAMVDAGAAVWYSPEALNATLRGTPGGAWSHSLVDYGGAARVLDYIVGVR